MVTMTKNALYINDLLGLMFIIASKETFAKGGKVHFGMQPLIDNCKTFFLARQNTTTTFFTWTMCRLVTPLGKNLLTLKSWKCVGMVIIHLVLTCSTN